MKKTLLLAFVCAALVACGKDDPIDLPQPAPKPAPEQQKESGNPENPNSDNPNPTPPNSEQPDSGQPAPAPIVTKEEITVYFGFSNEDVNSAIARTRTVKGVQKIGDKNIEVTKAEVNSKDETAGSFVLHLQGKVNDKAFETTLTFDGFTKRPDNYNMGKRVQGKWKAGVDKYAKFDLDYLLREKKTDKFTAEYLSEAIEFYSTDFDGTPFYYTEEDIKKSVISDMKYNSNGGGEISFNLTYGSAKSETPIRLAIDKNSYYAGKVTVDADFAKGLYVRGVEKNYALFGGRAIRYDEKLYAVQCVGANNANESEGKLTLDFKLMSVHGDGEALAIFSKEVGGFKLLKDLKDELVPLFNTDVQEVMKKYVDINTPVGDVKEKIKGKIENWIMKVNFSIKREGQWYDLVWDSDLRLLIGEVGQVMDIYLERPKFELVSASLKDEGRKMLYLGIKLLYANETSLSDNNVIFTLPIHIPSK